MEKIKPRQQPTLTAITRRGFLGLSFQSRCCNLGNSGHRGRERHNRCLQGAVYSALSACSSLQGSLAGSMLCQEAGLLRFTPVAGQCQFYLHPGCCHLGLNVLPLWEPSQANMREWDPKREQRRTGTLVRFPSFIASLRRETVNRLQGFHPSRTEPFSSPFECPLPSSSSEWEAVTALHHWHLRCSGNPWTVWERSAGSLCSSAPCAQPWVVQEPPLLAKGCCYQTPPASYQVPSTKFPPPHTLHPKALSQNQGQLHQLPPRY